MYDKKLKTIGPRITVDLATTWIERALKDARLYRWEYDRAIVLPGNERRSLSEMFRALDEAVGICLNSARSNDWHSALTWAAAAKSGARFLVTAQYGDQHRDTAVFNLMSRLDQFIAAVHAVHWDEARTSMDEWERELLSVLEED